MGSGVFFVELTLRVFQKRIIDCSQPVCTYHIHVAIFHRPKISLSGNCDLLKTGKVT